MPFKLSLAAIFVTAVAVCANCSTEEIRSPLVLAQSDAETAPEDQSGGQPAPKSLWSGNVEFGLQIREGNTETSDIYGKVQTLRKSEKREQSLLASFDHAEREGDTERSRAFAEYAHRFFRSTRSYLFGTANAEYDEVEDLDFRLNAAVGPGHKFVDTERTTLVGEVGLGATTEFYNGEDERFEAITFAHGLWKQKVFDRSLFSQDLTIYPSVSNFGSFRLVSTTSLTTPLSEALDLRISLHDEYDNDPEASGVEKNDLTFRTTLIYRF